MNDTRTVSYQHDNAGNRIRTTWPDAYFVTYEYDLLNRMKYVRENSSSANELAYYEYDGLSRRTLFCSGGQSGSCSSGGGTNKATYSYEADSNLDVLTQVLSGTTVTLDYGHNASGQITSIATNDEFYLAKPAGALATTTYTPNKLNQYGTINAGTALTPTYDLNGNTLTWYPLNTSGSKHTYTWDSENRLVTAAINGSGTASISYDYDALGRRQKKTVSGTVTQFLLDGDEEIAELDNSGAVLRRYITGPAVDDRIARAEGSATSNPTKYYYHTNHQGSVVAMTDNTGSTACSGCGRIAYDEYGNITTTGSPLASEPFGYTGRRFDPETGIYFYRARYYLPQIGRFGSGDPIGYKDNFNLYSYVGEDPANKTDPSGLALCEAAKQDNRDGYTCTAESAGKSSLLKPSKRDPQAEAYGKSVIKNLSTRSSEKSAVILKNPDGSFRQQIETAKPKSSIAGIETTVRGGPGIVSQHSHRDDQKSIAPGYINQQKNDGLVLNLGGISQIYNDNRTGTMTINQSGLVTYDVAGVLQSGELDQIKENLDKIQSALEAQAGAR